MTFLRQINTCLKKINIIQMNNYFTFCITQKFFRFELYNNITLSIDFTYISQYLNILRKMKFKTFFISEESGKRMRKVSHFRR